MRVCIADKAPLYIYLLETERPALKKRSVTLGPAEVQKNEISPERTIR